MNLGKEVCLERVSWPEISNEVRAVNNNLYNILEKISPPNDHYLYLASYSFGADINRERVLYLPCKDGSSKPYFEADISSEIIDDFRRYDQLHTMPLSLVLEKSTCVNLRSYDGRVIPSSITTPGMFNGVANAFDQYLQASFWYVTAGTPTLFMLPKISEYNAHLRLQKKYDLEIPAPKKITDNFLVFKDLNLSPEFGSSWRNKILIFGKKWFSHLDDPEWAPFYFYVLNKAWDSSSSRYARDTYILQPLFSYIQHKKELKVSHHLHDLIMHLFAIAAGVAPGFQVAQDDLLAPISRLQEIYIKDYELKKYAPIIMTPAHFDYQKDEASPVYYSLQYPTSFALTPRSSKHATHLTDLYQAASLIKKYLKEFLEIGSSKNYSRITQIAKNVQFEFFHNITEQYSNIRCAKEIGADDLQFMRSWLNTDNHEFPKNCSFFNGCIRISKRH